MNLDQKIGELNGKVDQILKNQQEEREWRRLHSGEGENTTHGVLNRKISDHEGKFQQMTGAGKLASWIGAGNVAAFIFWLISWFHDGGK